MLPATTRPLRARKVVMKTLRRHIEEHRNTRIGWLRAAVLGANDGIVSTASLLLGVGAASADHRGLLVAGAAGLVAGAMSMAAGEFVSVHAQADTEAADLARETAELRLQPQAERRELAGIYVARGLAAPLADEVAAALTAHDALGAHTRDELGLVPSQRARPVQAALASAASFAVGAALPLVVAMLAPAASLLAWVAGCSLGCLALLGLLAAQAGGTGRWASVLRVTFWGALAMAVTMGVGALL